MADNRKYYYMRLKDNFFDTNEIVVLESMPDGYLYSNILLKLYLRSLKDNGKLMFNDRIPYNSQMIATITRHQVGTVEKALQIFKEMGLIEVLDTGAIYMADIQKYIGQSSTEAERIRQYRQKIKTENLITEKSSVQMYNKSTPEIDIEIDIEKDIDINNKCSKSSDLEREFESLWKLYPNKKGKTKAHSKYLSLRKKNKITYEQVEQGINNYIFYIRENKVDPQYIKNGSTWFNQECWNDDYSVLKRADTDQMQRIWLEAKEEGKEIF